MAAYIDPGNNLYCYSHFYESSLLYGRVDVVVDDAIKNSPNLDIFWQARVNTVVPAKNDTLPTDCPQQHGELQFELTYRNLEKLERFGKSGNRQFLFLQFQDDDYIPPQDAVRDYRYDHLVIASLLDEKKKNTYDVHHLVNNTVNLTEENADIGLLGYENFT
jgi:hypothetical protein